MTETIERRGEVIAFEDGIATVRLAPATGCGGCGSRGTCASTNAASPLLNLQLPAHIRPGDQVSVSMPASSIVVAAIIGYLLPPFGLFLGAVLAEISFGSDIAAVLGAISGVLIGFLLARLISPFAVGHAAGHAVCSASSSHGDNL